MSNSINSSKYQSRKIGKVGFTITPVNIDWSSVLTQMVTASATSLQNAWHDLAPYVEHEMAGYLQDVQFVNNLLSDGKLTEEEASILLQMHKNSMKVVLMTAKGVGILAIEQAINAAINVLLGAVNSIANFVVA